MKEKEFVVVEEIKDDYQNGFVLIKKFTSKVKAEDYIKKSGKTNLLIIENNKGE